MFSLKVENTRGGIFELTNDAKNFQVTNIYRTIKDGNISISKNSDMIYLTTCDQIVKGYQLVIEGMLVS